MDKIIKIILLLIIVLILLFRKNINLDKYCLLIKNFINNLIKKFLNKDKEILNKDKEIKIDDIDEEILNKDKEIKIDDIDEEDLEVSENTLSIINDIHKDLINSNNVYLLINFNNNNYKIIIKLFNNIVPKTCNNFFKLCEQKKYKNNIFHRLVKNYIIQGGDITNQNGTGGKSIYGDEFDDENFTIKHDKKGIISMANSGPNTNNSQFFITLDKTPFLDDNYVAFGEIISDLNVLDIINNIEVSNEKPQSEIKIIDCGII